jgi:hypothetical protein
MGWFPGRASAVAQADRGCVASDRVMKGFLGEPNLGNRFF